MNISKLEIHMFEYYLLVLSVPLTIQPHILPNKLLVKPIIVYGVNVILWEDYKK